MSPDGANSRGAFTGVIAVAVASARLASKRNKTFAMNRFLVIIPGKRADAGIPKGIRDSVRLKSERGKVR